MAGLWWKKIVSRLGLTALSAEAQRWTGGEHRYARYYSDRILASPYEKLTSPGYFPEAYSEDVINLNETSPQLELPLALVRHADRLGKSPAWGLPELREVIAGKVAAQRNLVYRPESEVLATHGGLAAWAAVADAYLNPGDKVVMFDPSPSSLSVLAESRRARIRFVSSWQEEGYCRFFKRELDAALRGTMMLWLCDPSNPTGCRLSSQDVEAIAELCHKHDVLIVLDQSYSRWTPVHSEMPVCLDSRTQKRTLLIHSMTPSYGMNSLRLGWVVAPEPLLAAVAMMTFQNAPFASTLAQRIALQALLREEQLTEPAHARLEAKRDYACQRLSKLGFAIEPNVGGFYLWLSLNSFGIDGLTFAQNLLREQHVLVAPGFPFGPSSKDYIRLSCAGDEGRLREGLNRLADFLESGFASSMLSTGLHDAPAKLLTTRAEEVSPGSWSNSEQENVEDTQNLQELASIERG